MSIVIPGPPIPLPRMTQRDKWRQRPSVLRYREYADRLREHVRRAQKSQAVSFSGMLQATFFLPMPKSWSKKKRANMEGSIHQVKPDLDNLIKGCADALIKQDQNIYKIHAVKYWEDQMGPRTVVWV